jgi:hypothetical protein
VKAVSAGKLDHINSNHLPGAALTKQPKNPTRRTALTFGSGVAMSAALPQPAHPASPPSSHPAVKTGVIHVNHVGFPPHAPKHCVIPVPPEKTFTIHRLKDTVWTQAFSGRLADGGSELEPGSVGDFTALKEDGIYQVRCGALRSRCFIVHQAVYDVPMRVIFGYFPMARCGDTTKGWAGPCHLNDGNLAGEHHDFAGGYHQSSDLRKWSAFEILGLMGLVEYGQKETPRWDNGSLTEEIRWGSDYFQKLVRDDGGMYDSVFIPLGWGPRDYYPTDPPPPALWNMIGYQASAARYFATRDAAYAAKCRNTAEKVWRYMISAKRPRDLYRPPAMPPLGHGPLKTMYDSFYEGSAQELAHRLGAALALHRATGDAALLEDAARAASALLELQAVDDSAPAKRSAVFWEGPNSDRLASSALGFGYFGNGAIALGLVEMAAAAPQHRDAARWREAALRIAEQYCQTARRNPWGLVATDFTVRDTPATPGQAPVNRPAQSSVTPTFDQITSTPAEFYPAGAIRPPSGGGAKKYVGYQYRRYLYHYQITLAALFLNRVAEMGGPAACRATAQRQLDWIMGCNPFDASAIEGVGYNQPDRGLYGEFFPPTPQIPGAVSINLLEESFDPEKYGMVNEYDMPIAGDVLWLMAEQARSSG